MQMQWLYQQQEQQQHVAVGAGCSAFHHLHAVGVCCMQIASNWCETAARHVTSSPSHRGHTQSHQDEAAVKL